MQLLGVLLSTQSPVTWHKLLLCSASNRLLLLTQAAMAWSLLLLVGHPGFLNGAGPTLFIINPLCKPEGGPVEVCPSQGGRDQLSAVLVPSFLTPKITMEHVGGTIASAGA